VGCGIWMENEYKYYMQEYNGLEILHIQMMKKHA
jgi:hypothetical protein